MIDHPKRIQLSRAKGWRMPPNTVKVDRTTKWGNPYAIGLRDHNNDVIEDRQDAMRAFECWAEDCLDDRCIHKGIFADLDELRGKNLACWCPLDEPCHADVLLRVSNA